MNDYYHLIYLSFCVSRKAGPTLAKARRSKDAGTSNAFGGVAAFPSTGVEHHPTTASTTSIAAVPDHNIASNFHKELMETCIDMLARYTHFTSYSVPKRFVLLFLSSSSSLCKCLLLSI